MQLIYQIKLKYEKSKNEWSGHILENGMSLLEVMNSTLFLSGEI